jgi:hypothetical protein
MKTSVLASINTKLFLLELIENEIKNGRLVYGLSQLNINAEEYHLNLSGLIFSLLGYDNQKVPDPVSDTYFELIRRASLINPENQYKPQELAIMIYEEMQNLDLRG